MSGDGGRCTGGGGYSASACAHLSQRVSLHLHGPTAAGQQQRGSSTPSALCCFQVIFHPTDNPEGRFDFQWFQRNVLWPGARQFRTALRGSEPALLLMDDTNTVLKDCVEKLSLALKAGVPLSHVGWFVQDQGKPENEEVCVRVWETPSLPVV